MFEKHIQVSIQDVHEGIGTGLTVKILKVLTMFFPSPTHQAIGACPELNTAEFNSFNVNVNVHLSRHWGEHCHRGQESRTKCHWYPLVTT